jgi:hypothetical protein
LRSISERPRTESPAGHVLLGLQCDRRPVAFGATPGGLEPSTTANRPCCGAPLALHVRLACESSPIYPGTDCDQFWQASDRNRAVHRFARPGSAGHPDHARGGPPRSERISGRPPPPAARLGCKRELADGRAAFGRRNSGSNGRLQHGRPRVAPARTTPVAFNHRGLSDRSSLRLFEACSYKPAPKGPPSSQAQHRVHRTRSWHNRPRNPAIVLPSTHRNGRIWEGGQFCQCSISVCRGLFDQVVQG